LKTCGQQRRYRPQTIIDCFRGALYHTALDQAAYDLLDEKWVSLRFIRHQFSNFSRKIVNLAIYSMLRGCDVVRLKIEDVVRVA
jgi:hypothetical protein